MSRVCTICAHKNLAEINEALLNNEPYRHIASQHLVSTASLQRHRAHIPGTLAKAAEAEEVAQADDLLTQLKGLRNKAVALLLKAEGVGDYKTALAGVREARACLELLFELEGELDRRPTTNILINPSWITVRAVLMEALHDHPDVRVVVAQRLKQLEGGSAL